MRQASPATYSTTCTCTCYWEAQPTGQVRRARWRDSSWWRREPGAPKLSRLSQYSKKRISLAHLRCGLRRCWHRKQTGVWFAALCAEWQAGLLEPHYLLSHQALRLCMSLTPTHLVQALSKERWILRHLLPSRTAPWSPTSRGRILSSPRPQPRKLAGPPQACAKRQGTREPRCCQLQLSIKLLRAGAESVKSAPTALPL